MSKHWNLEKRDKIVTAYWTSERRTSQPIIDTLTSGQRKREYAKQDRLLDEYGEGMPLVQVSRCPFCSNILKYPFDPFGLDGLWWEKDKIVEAPEPEGDDHFCVLLGAIDFHGREPVEAKEHDEILPGPGAPFVVPRMLEIPDLKAVISSIELPFGDTAYLISYFCENPIHGALLHQPWAREDYEVFDEDGEYEAWTVANDEWDFELQPWIDKGLLMWIEPEDKSFTLQSQGPCPYTNLPGVRAPQIIEEGKLSLLPLPDGEPLDPFD